MASNGITAGAMALPSVVFSGDVLRIGVPAGVLPWLAPASPQL
jgi:hypothetical protein